MRSIIIKSLSKKSFLKSIYLLLLLIILANTKGCAPTLLLGENLKSENLVDGKYTGSDKGGPNYAKVEILIKNQKI